MARIQFGCLLIWMIGTVLGTDDAAPSAAAPNLKNITEEMRLFNHLLDPTRYVPSVRPALNPRDPIPVKFGLELISLDGIDHATQILDAHVWMLVKWHDPMLVWDPADYNWVTELNVPINSIWRPDVLLWNNAANDAMPDEHYLAVVTSNGHVKYIPYLKVSVFCGLRLKKFPFDTQSCEFTFGSWTYEQKKVNLTFMTDNETGRKIGQHFYVEHQEWEVIPKKAEKLAIRHLTKTYVSTKWRIDLKRKSTFYSRLFIAPSVLLMVAIPAMFNMPPESGEKLTLGVGILISQTILLHMLTEFIPSAHSEMPLLGTYYLSCLVLVTISLILCTVVSRAWSQSSRQRGVPGCCRTVVLGVLGRLLCISGDSFMPRDEPTADPMTFRRLDDLHSDPGSQQQPTFDGHPPDDRARMFQTYSQITSVAEWRQLASILDRLFLIVFVILVVVISFMLGH